MKDTRISGRDFAEMLSYGAKTLNMHRKEVNDLNVFPIPDGDTGDNMLMTFSNGADAAAKADGLTAVAKAAASGMLLGARGNSGVILSRIFAGITREFEGLEEASLDDLKRGMCRGVRESYASVSKPVEGTILTVFKDAVNYAESADNGTIAAYFNSMYDEMQRSLDRTPELLPVLMEAGVVDSGGAGLLYIFEGIKRYVNGETNDVVIDEMAATSLGQKNEVDFSLFTADSLLEFGYCTELLLRLQNRKTDIENFDVEGFIRHLEGMGGESVVAFKEDSIVKVHVHIRTPGDVLNYAQNFGEFLTLKVENMTFQNNEAVNRGDNAQSALKRKLKKKNAFVVVAAGEGIKQVFNEMNADYIVEGGQSMNPSAQDFINAFNEVNARHIFVFPNNSNVILTAKQAAELYTESEVTVIETKSVGECYAALSFIQADGEVEDIKQTAEETVNEVITAYVSLASRNAELNGVEVHCGDYIGFANGDVYCDSVDKDCAARTLLSRLNLDDYGVLIIFVGKDGDMAEAEKLRSDIEKTHRGLEAIVLDGGQPIYDYMFVIE